MRRLLLPLLALIALLGLFACPATSDDDDSVVTPDDDDSVVEDDDDSVVVDDDDSVVPDDDDSVIAPDDDDSGCEEVRICGWSNDQGMFACGGTDTAPPDTPDCYGDWTADCGPTTGGTSCCDDQGNLNYCYYESGDTHLDVEKCPLDCI